MTTQTRTPTMDDVAALEAEFATRTHELEEQRATAQGAARQARETLTEEAIDRQVRAEAKVRALEGRCADLAAQITTDRQAALQASAVERLTKGIPRAYGSLHNEYRRDAERVVAAAQNLRLELERWNDRYRSVTVLRLEAEYVARRFGLPMPDLPHVLPPVRLVGVVAALREAQMLGLRDVLHPSERETRRLIAGTPGGQLLAEAGPSDEEKQQAEAAAAKDQERQARDAAAVALIAPLLGEIEAAKGLPLSRF